VKNLRKAMKYFVYVIKSCKDGRLYVGLSKDPENRLKDHNFGRVFSTKGFKPWKVVYTEKVYNRSEARQREKYLKSGIGKEYLKSIINKPR
jgi:putative endonuclease